MASCLELPCGSSSERFAWFRAWVTTQSLGGSIEEMKALAKKMSDARHHILAGADHGFSVRQSDGRVREDVWEEAATALVGWLGELA